MKRTVLGLALVAGFMFMISSAFANPALLKKAHEGYPNEGAGTTATGEAATLKSAEDAPKDLKNQNRDALGGVENQDQLKRSEDSRLPAVMGSGHVTSKGVTENQIKEATKVNASPK